MRALEVLGLAEDGAHLVCHDATTGEEFALPADERLRAAARGDITRLGQLEIEMDSQLRPREIQARIRAGESVAEVAAAAGTSTGKIERFAYPVLMERSAIAERCNSARPVGPAGPAAVSIAEIVADTLNSRGHSGPVTWDAFKDTGGWVMVVRWRAGRSQNAAHFAYHPGPGGGTVAPRDDAATDLLDPAPRPLRTVRSEPAVRSEPPYEVPAPGEPRELVETQRIPRVAEPSQAPDAPAPRSPQGSRSPQEPEAPQGSQSASADRLPDDPADPAPAAGEAEAEPTNDDLAADVVEDERSGARPRREPREHREQIAKTGTDHVSARPAGRTRGGRSGKPAMPSWDDVLLGSGVRKR